MIAAVLPDSEAAAIKGDVPSSSIIIDISLSFYHYTSLFTNDCFIIIII